MRGRLWMNPVGSFTLWMDLAHGFPCLGREFPSLEL